MKTIDDGFDTMQRKLAYGGDFRLGLMSIEVKRDPEFKELRIMIEGEIALTITASANGRGQIQVHKGSTFDVV